MNNIQKISAINLILTLLIILSILFIDKPLAAFVANNLTGIKPFFFYFTNVFDRLFYPLFWIIIGFLGVGVSFLFRKRTKKVGLTLFTVIFAVFVAYGVVAGNMKAAFKRARPALYINGDEKTIDFFSEQTRDYSFPSAHTAFYFSFFLPFALAFKRYLPLILFIPAVIAIGRVVQNDHYLSDVLCSILIVFNICLLTYWVLNSIDNTWVNFKTKRMERSR